MTDQHTPPHRLRMADFLPVEWWCVPGMTGEYGAADTPEARAQTQLWESADCVASALLNQPGHHWPMLDLDHPCRLIESETPGHHHLIIEKPLPWDDYVKLLTVLAEVGMIEPGYVSASIERGRTFLATRPWKAARDARTAAKAEEKF